eukprot:434989-Pelagomonas_calceolata.AAC.3
MQLADTLASLPLRCCAEWLCVDASVLVTVLLGYRDTGDPSVVHPVANASPYLHLVIGAMHSGCHQQRGSAGCFRAPYLAAQAQRVVWAFFEGHQPCNL